MPFKDASGIELLTLADLWDEAADGPLGSLDGATLAPGGSPRAMRSRNGGARLAGMGRVAYFVVLDHGPGSVGRSGWRYGPYGVGEGEDPQAVAFENSGDLLPGRWTALDSALGFALELNCAALVMDS